MVADVGARIRSLRTAKGMTQAQVAEPNYTKAYISMLESGRTRASMKALEHIAGVLGVKPADLLGGVAAPATPQYQLLEARRYIEQQRPTEAIPILEALEEGLGATDQLVRLRFLATAFNMTGQPKAAFPLIERAQRMAELLEDEEEKVRVNAVLASAYSRTYAYEEALRLLREIVAACEDGVPNDPAFHFRRLVDLAVVLTNLRQPKQALAAYERAIVLGEKFSDRPALGNLYAGMAKTHQNEGDLEAAIVYNQKSLQIFEELGLFDQVACTLDNAALLYAEYGNRERARECLARAAALAIETQRDGTLASVRGGGRGEDRSEAGPRDRAGSAQVRAQSRSARCAGQAARTSRRAPHERQRGRRAPVLPGGAPARGRASAAPASRDLRSLVPLRRVHRRQRGGAAARAPRAGDSSHIGSRGPA